MKIRLVFALLTVLVSCSTLEKTTYDRGIRFQGTYECERFSKEPKNLKESLAEADVSRIRCAKDEWRIEDNDLVFTRSLYQDKNCVGLLGRIVFSLPMKQTTVSITAQNPSCRLVRMNPNWIAEDSGRCMLNELILNAPNPISNLKRCRTYVPQFCRTSKAEIIAEPVSSLEERESIKTMKFISSTDGTQTCKRFGE